MEEISQEVRFEIVRQFLLDSLAANLQRWPKEESAFLRELIEGERRLVREFSARLIREHYRFGHPDADPKLVEHLARLVEGEGVDDEWRDHGSGGID